MKTKRLTLLAIQMVAAIFFTMSAKGLPILTTQKTNGERVTLHFEKPFPPSPFKKLYGSCMRLLAHLYAGKNLVDKDLVANDIALFSNELLDHTINVHKEIFEMIQKPETYVREDIMYIHHALKLIMRSYTVLSRTYTHENMEHIKNLLHEIINKLDQLLGMASLRHGYHVVVGAATQLEMRPAPRG